MPATPQTPKNESNLYAQVIVSLAVSAPLTYLVPPHLQPTIKVGMRVEVSVARKNYAGIIYELNNIPPQNLKKNINFKNIVNIIDNEPIVTNTQLQLWNFIATYYMCSLGEVMQAALPSAFKLTSETTFLLNPAFNHDFSLLTNNEFMIAQALTIQNELTLNEIEQILDRKNVFFIIKALIEKNVILVKEELIEKFKPQTITLLGFTNEYTENEQLIKNAFEQVARSKHQTNILLAYIQLKNQQNTPFIPQNLILEKANQSTAAANADTTHLKKLIEKNIFTQKKQTISRLQNPNAEFTNPQKFELTPQQQTAYTQIIQFWEQKKPVLLHGVTSSGKTQIYLQLIEKQLNEGKQALYLMPEIALTTQMINRLQAVFGNKVGIYHSKFTDAERIEIWHKVLKKEYTIILGARSALFLPFQQLGCIIIDEEHDNSYKQTNPAPRYHARDTALYMATLYHAHVILGSATPSIETYYHATQTQKFALVTLNSRYGGVLPPIINIVNIANIQKNNEMKAHFSPQLIETLNNTLNNKKQAIVFQNRRGYAPYLICSNCQQIPKCHQCDVSLTYHKQKNELRCHYCNYATKLITKCTACSSTHLQIQGFGTEKIEDELHIFFPNHTIQRLDLDTARTKKGFQKIISDFEDGNVNILVGTQMVTKGLDFQNVTTVAVLDADAILAFPDFRTHERGLQLLLQVSGRAGRRNQQGTVIIQAKKINNPLFEYLLNNDYPAFFKTEIIERKQFLYPPFVRLICLTLKHKNPNEVNDAAFELTKILRNTLKNNVLSPAIPMVAFIKNFHLRQIIIKIEPNQKAIANCRQTIYNSIETLQNLKSTFKNMVIQIDVDAYF